MLHEFGIFNNEGLVQGRFFSREKAVEALDEYICEEGERGDPRVLEICPEHEGQPKHGCSECQGDLFVDEDFFAGEDED